MNLDILDSNIRKRFEAVSRSKTFNHIIERFNLSNKEVLDIGCSYGEFLYHFGRGSTGLTIIENEVKVGKSLGLDLRKANIEYPDTVKLEKLYDVIFANNIFEHMLSPHLFLLNIKRYLKPGGFLILGVPCLPKFLSMIRFRRFRGSLAVLHINFFTRDTLMKTVKEGGWDIKECRGFRFRNHYIDRMASIIWPHFYAIAWVRQGFEYSSKREKEAREYGVRNLMPKSN